MGGTPRYIKFNHYGLLCRNSVADGAYLDNYTITVSPARGVDSRCGNESWSATVLPVMPSKLSALLTLANIIENEYAIYTVIVNGLV